MSSFSRQDVLRILQISSHQLHGWEKAGLIAAQETYSFQDLGQLKTLRSLREEDVPAASIRHSISAMKAVSEIKKATNMRGAKPELGPPNSTGAGCWPRHQRMDM